MPRHPRLFVPYVPLHVVHRGHDRKPVFAESADYRYYLANLRETKKKLSVQVYAYCLMTNHVHLIISPGEQTDHVSKLMRIVAARQTRYVNKLEKRTGTLWEGRFKASLIETDAYLLACCRYVELNPVRAAMVTSPQDYPWSSYRVRGTIGDVDLLDPCYVYEALGKTEAERFLAYESLVAEGISDDELNMIRTAVQRNQLTGTQHFRDDIARRSGRRVSARGQGRPRKRV